MSRYQTNIDWLGEPPAIDESKITEELTADVVVVGAGHAGIQAALAAAEEGAGVLVIEVQKEKYWKVYGEDIGIWNAGWLINKGFGPYRTGDVVNEYVKRSAGRVNPELIRQYVQNSGEMFDHMVALAGGEEAFDEQFRYGSDENGELIVHQQQGTEHYPIESGGYRTWASAIQFVGPISHETTPGCASRSNLHRFQEIAVQESRRLGAKWLYETEAAVLLQDEERAVVGVIAENRADHHLLRIHAKKAVLVATGDFGGNSKMCTALLTEASEWGARFGKASVQGKNGRNGSGHKMCCWAGGLIEPAPRGCMNLGGGPPAPWGSAPMLWLNSEGKRFCNEGAQPVTAGAAARQPRGIIAAVTDANFMESVRASGVEHGAPNYGRPVYYEELQEDMKTAGLPENSPGASKGKIPVRGATVIERKGGDVYAADTLSSLLASLGYSGSAAQTALKQIRRYNDLCHKKEDIDFGKDAAALIPIEKPPFYAVKKENDGQQNIGLVTLAGLVTDDAMNVLDADGKPIPGLYVAGNTLGGRYGIGYSTPTAGTSIGMAMTHGRIVGKTMAHLSDRKEKNDEKKMA